jgi:fibro-slime domain-containing protein
MTQRHSHFQTIFVILILFLFNIVIGQTKTTIHILHPWADDPERSVNPPYIISSETGYYPGTLMNAEGGSWYTYTFTKLNRKTNDRIEFASYIPDEYNDYNKPERFPTGQQLIFLDIFAGSSEKINEAWIIPSASGSVPRIVLTPPPGGKVICMLNPWDLGAPRIIINNLGIATMRVDARSERCGWFVYNYYGSTNAINVLFKNSLDSTPYGKNGIGNMDSIDCTALLSNSDSVWVYRSLSTESVVKVASRYPDIIGECSKTINLAALMRDIGLHPDFGTYQELEAEDCGGWQQGMVQEMLGPDGKPVKKTHQCKMIHSRFDWFETQTFANGYTNETCYNLTLTKNEEGLFAYETDSFYPLDNFEYLDSEQKVRNPNNNLYIDPNNKPPFNVHFTMELSAQFEYHKGQTFYFRGDDDVWVFIDSQLVVDLGGNHGPIEGSVRLDELGLVQGKTYNFKLFFVERNCCGSNFLMQTSLNLRTESRLFTVMKIPEPGQIQFSFFERISRSSLACDASESEVDTIDAKAQFFIEGPQFTNYQELPSGLSYNGIYISDKKNIITVDTSLITGLTPGTYVITSQLVSDPSQLSKVIFTIIQPPKPQIVKNPVVAAAYFADNGNGQVTRAEIYYTNPLIKLPDSLVLFWPEPIPNNRRIAVDTSEIILDPLNARHLTIQLSLPFDTLNTRNKGTTQLGTSYINDTTFTDPRDIARFNIADSVGPLLTFALFPERKASEGNDTLLLTFSERITDSLIIGKSLILKKSNGAESEVTIVSFSQRLDTLIVITEPFSAPPAIGDSIRIAATGPLTDQFGNHAHPFNRPVPLIIRKAAGNVSVSYYSDSNADGIIDRITFHFDRPVLLNNCSFSIFWISTVIASLVSENALHYNGDDSAVIILDLNKALSTPLPLRTWGMMTYYMSIDNASSIDAQQSGNVVDSAAPVVAQASYHPAVFIAGKESVLPDTIRVTLSEQIQPSLQLTPLVMKKPGSSSTFSPELKLLWQKDTILTFLVSTPIPDTFFPEDNDSVYINITASVSDLPGSVQKNPGNHRALFDFVESKPHFRIIYGPNPFNPHSEDFEFIIDPYIKSRNTVAFTVQCTIYDKTGSVVFESRRLDSPATGTYIISWNGTNKKNRYVGTGTYLANIKVFDMKNGGKRIITDNEGPILLGVRK